MNERDFFTEKPEMKPMSLACPKCRHRDDYQIKWVRFTKKDRLPPNANPADRAKFEKLRDYLYRMDDMVNCSRCKRRFEIPSHQNMVFL
jgi:DNA-directed RNA polymerase subunit RPC12/RpoP